MPLYDHECECGKWLAEYRPIADWDKLPTCPKCGELMPVSIRLQSSAVRANYKKPIRLESMGFLAEPEDVAEHRKRFPDVELEIHEGSAVPVLRSLGQKRAYFKAAGLADMRSF